MDGQKETLDSAYFNVGRSSEPVRTDPLAFTVKWYSKSKLLHKWSEATRDVYFDFADGVLWKLDCFDPNKVITYEKNTRIETSPDYQDDLFPESRIEKQIQTQHMQKTVSLGVFIPIRIEEFVISLMKGTFVEGTNE